MNKSSSGLANSVVLSIFEGIILSGFNQNHIFKDM